MLNFNQFRVFYYAAKHLNFTRAAADLFISQPAVTAQMKAFEDYCGFKVFKKKGRKNWLTDEGKSLFEYASAVFALEKDIEGTVDDMRLLNRGVLRIGTTKAYARYFMPLMLSTFHGKYPKIKIELNEGSSHEMALSLLEFKNEVVVIAKTGDIDGIQYIPFSQEEMVLVTAPDHPFREKKAIYFKNLGDVPFIMKDRGSGTRKLVDELFKQKNCKPDILMEVSNTEFIKELVHRGDGVSLLVRETVAAELAEGKLAAIPLKGESLYLDVSICYLADQHLSPSARAFVTTLEQLRSGREVTPQGIGEYMAKISAQYRKNSNQ
jgi:LysR family transcriptional regulator, low CO2-responsive transcriptional regulator